jgi:hypothetical protein
MRLKPRADEGGETGETGDLDPPLIKASERYGRWFRRSALISSLQPL